MPKNKRKRAEDEDGNPSQPSKRRKNPEDEEPQVDAPALVTSMAEGELLPTDETQHEIKVEFGEDDKISRSDRIKGLLEHRKILLERLRLGKKAARARIDSRKDTEEFKDLDESKEIKRFKDMLRESNAIARKQSRTDADGNVEKRSALSLRRGASVGKKMNAALSSLIPGSATSAEVEAVKQNLPSQKVSAPKSVSVAQKTPQGRSAAPVAAATAPATSASARQENAPSSASTKSRPGSIRSNSQTRVPASIVCSSLPDERLPASRRRNPTVVCSEAAELRDRRTFLQEQLGLIYEKRSSQFTGNSFPISLREWRKGPRSSLTLPARRKTHWDTLLHEMKWMATDFQQERRWKRSMSRTLGQAFLKRNEPQKFVSVSTGLSETMDVEEPKVQTIIEEPVSGTRGDKSHGDIHYSVLTADEVSSARDCATSVSKLLHDFATSVRENQTDSETLEACGGDHEASGVKLESADEKSESELVRKTTSKKILHSINSVLSNIESKLEVTRKALKVPPKKGNDFSSALRESLNKAESLWNDFECGSVLYGPVASGKTSIAVDWLVSGSPCLVVCQSNAVFRWLNCFSRDESIRCRVYQGKDSIDGLEPTPPSGRDILVVDTRVFKDMEEDTLDIFQRVVIDIRFPSGFFGSRGRSAHEYDPPFSANLPSEFKDEEWWFKLAKSLNRRKIPRLLVANFSIEMFDSFLVGVTDRKALNIISTICGVLVAPLEFDAKCYPKEILRWARSKVRESKMKGSKLSRVKTLLFSLVSNLSIEHSLSATLDRREKEGVIDWELFPCKMDSHQRLSYDHACSEFRSILCTEIDCRHAAETEALNSVADAMLSLRATTFHANNSLVMDKLYGATRCRSGEGLSPRLELLSSSQTDTSMASSILRSSCKLLELLRFLYSTPKFTTKINGSKFFDSFGIKKTTTTTTTTSRAVSKIVIVACSMEAQITTSILLNSLGVQHELLLDPFSRSSHTTWVRCQLALSSFAKADKSDGCRIIIGSPIVLAGDHGGVAVGYADVVFSLDEDWSGCMILPYLHLQTRCRSARFIKLVASETCEAFFLGSGSDDKRDDPSSYIGKSWPWPISPYGQFYPPKSFSAVRESDTFGNALGRANSFRFPLGFIAKSSGESISKVLSSADMKPSFLSSSPEQFLPSLTDGGKESVSLRFLLLRLLFRREQDVLGAKLSNFLAKTRTLQEGSTIASKLTDYSFMGVTSHLERVLADEKYPVESGAVHVLSEDTRAGSSEPVEAVVNPWREKFSQMRTTDAAQELLMYKSERDTHGLERANLFATLFSNSNFTCNDGSQGQESLLYFPPLFPCIQECHRLASSQINGLSPESKLLVGSEDGGSTQDNVLTHSIAPEIVTEDESSKNDAASVLVDLRDDYGLAGVGAVPLPRDSALFSGTVNFSSSESGEHCVRLNEWLSDTSPGDSEEIELSGHTTLPLSHADKILLVVSRKRPRGNSLQGNGQQQRILPSSHSSMSIVKSGVPTDASAFINIAPQQPRIQGALAFTKSKDSTKNRILASTRQPGLSTSIFESPAYKMAAYHVTERIQERVSDHCWASHNAFEQGPGLPLFVSKQFPTGRRGLHRREEGMWTSVVKRLKNRDSVTGDESLELAMNQAAAFRRSYSSPCRVDFGPFHVGFLASPAGMTTALPPRSHSGLSLPMGVKPSSGSRGNHLDLWTAEKNHMLKAAVYRYNANWMLVTSFVNELRVSAVSTAYFNDALPCVSSRLCRDRWQRIAREDPIAAKEVKEKDTGMREIAFSTVGGDTIVPSSRMETRGDLPVEVVVSEKMKLNMDTSPFENKTSQEIRSEGKLDLGRGTRFSAFLGSKGKRKVVPLKLSAGDGSVQPITASHESHMQSVQASATASATGGKTEVWPLPLLEALDRHRSKSIPSSSFSRPGSSNGHHSGNFQHQSRPGAGSVQGFGPPPKANTSGRSS